MYERFTDNAREVMNIANHNAKSLNRQNIDTDNVLVGMMGNENGFAYNVLTGLGQDYETLLNIVNRTETNGTPFVPKSVSRLSHSQYTDRLIDYAMEESRNSNLNHVGSEHLLLGLTRHDLFRGRKVLIEQGLSPQDIIGAVDAQYGKQNFKNGLATALQILDYSVRGNEIFTSSDSTDRIGIIGDNEVVIPYDACNEMSEMGARFNLRDELGIREVKTREVRDTKPVSNQHQDQMNASAIKHLAFSASRLLDLANRIADLPKK